VICTVVFPLSLSVGWSVLARYAEHHPYFTVQEIIVEENAGFSQDDLQEWGGVKVGMSMWEVDPEQVESRLLAHSWIQSAQVRRDFPQRLHVAVSTRRPVAVVLHDGPVYLDEAGICFTKPDRTFGADLPYVSGLSGASLDAPSTRSALDGALRLLSLSRLWQEPLSEIHWDAQQGFTLFLEQRRVTVRLGWETAPEKFAQIGIVLTEWPKEAPAAVFDARFADQIVVRPYVGEGRSQGRALSRPL
jgi:cell division septal protein FtsQ